MLDHELVRHLAARLSCEEGEVVAMDEHAPSFLERLAAMAVVTAPESRVHSTPWATDPDCVAARPARCCWRRPRILLYRRGARGQLSLPRRTDVLRIRVAAPFDVRVRRVAQRTGASPNGPPPRSDARSQTGSTICSATTRATSTMPCEYDLQINTGTISLEAAVHLGPQPVRTDPHRTSRPLLLISMTANCHPAHLRP